MPTRVLTLMIHTRSLVPIICVTVETVNFVICTPEFAFEFVDVLECVDKLLAHFLDAIKAPALTGVRAIR